MKTMLGIAAALVAAVLALGPMSTQITAYAQDIGDVWETEMKSENEQIELENEQTGETEMETEDSQITIRLPGTTNFEFP